MEPLSRRAKLTAFIVASAFFMQNLDSTIIATAVPEIAASFDANPVHLSIAITAYLLSSAIFMPVSGWLADRYGARTIFRAAIALFTAASMACGFSDSVVELTIARTLQGMGAAMLMPVGRLVIVRSGPRTDMLRTMSYVTMTSQVGPILGPLVGGFFTTYFSWRWNFYINLPIGVAGYVLAGIYIENHRNTERVPFDWQGAALSGLGLAGLMYGLEAVSHGQLSGATITGILITSLVLCAVAVWHLLRIPAPLLDLRLLRLPTFRVNLETGSAYRAGYGGLGFLLPLLFQLVFGMTPFASGFLTVLTAVGSVTMNQVSPRIIGRYGFRSVILWNGVLAAVSYAWCALFDPSVPIAAIVVVLLITGLTQSLQYTSFSVIAYADVEERRMSAATSMAQMVQQIARGAGVAICAIALSLSLTWRGGAGYELSDFVAAFVMLGVATLISLAGALRLPQHAGSSITGPKPKG